MDGGSIADIHQRGGDGALGRERDFVQEVAEVVELRVLSREHGTAEKEIDLCRTTGVAQEKKTRTGIEDAR